MKLLSDFHLGIRFSVMSGTFSYVFPNFAQKNCHQGFSKSVFVCIISV